MGIIYIKLTLSNGLKRLVPIFRVVDFLHKKNKTKTREQILQELESDHGQIMHVCEQMKWLDAFPCKCGQGDFDFEKEWIESSKELIQC
jgi:hypothetical protein